RTVGDERSAKFVNALSMLDGSELALNGGEPASGFATQLKNSGDCSPLAANNGAAAPGTLCSEDEKASKVEPAPSASSVPVGGGSAMPCGFVSPGLSAKFAAAFWLPDVRVAAAVYW